MGNVDERSAAGGIGAQADDHVLAGLLQVERVRVPLGAIPEDRDRLAGERFGVGIGVVIDLVVIHRRGTLRIRARGPLDEPLGELAAASLGVEPDHEAVVVNSPH